MIKTDLSIKIKEEKIISSPKQCAYRTQDSMSYKECNYPKSKCLGCNDSNRFPVKCPLKSVSNENKTSERILCAALNYKGIIIAGHRHSDCYAVIENLYKMFTTDTIGLTSLPKREHQGFLTSHNRYVSRAEAWEIAKANDQIAFGKDSSDDFLISENLY